MTTPAPKSAAPKSTAPKADGDKFSIPEEWRIRCEVSQLNSSTKNNYIPLHGDLIRALLHMDHLEFKVYLASGWDLVEFIKPTEFSTDLVRELIEVHKKYPTQTKICMQRSVFGLYERLASKFRRDRFEAAAGPTALGLDGPFKLYEQLSIASQTVVRGYLGTENFLRVSSAASNAITNMCSTRDVIQFVTTVLSKDPVIYDHAAVTALLSAAISWNVLRLPKRESKLTVQAALLHDVERYCAYLFKPAVPNQLSIHAIKEIESHIGAKIGYHETTLEVMRQYREKFGGGGFPRGAKGSFEENPLNGISKMARIVSIACGFSEYLLKRQDKQPLTAAAICGLIAERSESDFDPHIVTAFLADMENGTPRRDKAMKNDSGEDDGDDF